MAKRGRPKKELNRLVEVMFLAVQKGLRKEVMREIGEEVIAAVVKRSRNGLGVKKPAGKEKPFPKLSKKYKNFRKTFGKLDKKTTTPTKSNITLTGQMLRSVQIIKLADRKMAYGPAGSRLRYKKKKDGSYDPFVDKLKNAQLGLILTRKMKRPFLNPSYKDINRIAKKVDKILAKELKKI